MLALAKERIKKLSDFLPLTKFLVEDPAKGQIDESTKKLLTALSKKFATTAWSTSEIEATVRAVSAELDIPAKEAFMSLRVAITGDKVSLPLNESMIILGKDAVLKRLSLAINDCQKSA